METPRGACDSVGEQGILRLRLCFAFCEAQSSLRMTEFIKGWLTGEALVGRGNPDALGGSVT